MSHPDQEKGSQQVGPDRPGDDSAQTGKEPADADRLPRDGDGDGGPAERDG